MASKGALVIRFAGDTRDFDRATKSVQASTSRLGASLKRAAVIGAAALGAAAVVGGKSLFEMGQKASDLNETISKTNQIFGGRAAKSLQKWAEGAATSLGQSQQTALDAAATFGVFGKSAGKSGMELAKFSKQNTKLATDLASFHNASPEEAIEALGAAFRGEAEPIRRFGILLDDATLRNEALKLGLIKTTKEALTPSQKVLAAQAAIMKQTSDAQGDFARTSGGLANQQRILKAKFENLQTAVGQKVLPIMLKLVTFANDRLIPALSNVGGFARDMASKVSGAFKRLNLGGFAGKVKRALSGIDIKGLGKDLARQGKSWAKPVIDGFKTGLNTGDWSGLGSALGTGIVQAVKGIGQMIGKVTSALVEIFGKVDWMGIGIAMGKQAPTLLVGLAMGLLNFDIGGLLKGLADHWQEALFAVITVAFMPAKVIGAVGKALAKIPFVGKMLEWALLHFKKFSDGLVGMVGKALKFLGSAFMSGFRRVFPSVGKSFAENLALLPLRLQIMALDLAQKAGRMMTNFAGAIGRGIAGVVAKIGELTGKMLKPFVNAGSWLIETGKNLIRGLISGIWSMAGDLVNAIKSAVTDKIPGFIKDRLGIHSPSVVLAEIGANLMRGLVKGIESKGVMLQTALDKVLSFVQRMNDKISNLMSQRSGIISSFQGFTSSVFNASFDNPETEQTEKPSVQAMLDFQKQQAGRAQRLKNAVRKLTKMGLSKSLIQQLAASGESGIEQIYALAQGSKSQISQLNALNASTTSALNAAGVTAGDAAFGDEIAQAKRDKSLAQEIAKQLRQLLKEQGKDERIVVQLDGRTLHWSLVKLKRESGKNLGLT